MRPPTTAGVPYPSPISESCQSSFGPALGHSLRRPVSCEMPVRCGPRSWGQSAAQATQESRLAAISGQPVRNLPIDDGTIIRIISRPVLLRLANHCLELILVDGDSEPWLGEQRTISVLHRRQRLCEEVIVFRIAAFLNQEIRNRRA